MNRKRRYGTLAAVTFTATLVATLALVPLADQQAFARPQPTGPVVGDHVMKINLIGVPNGTDRNCDSGSSNNIYTPRGTDDGNKIDDNIHHQHILWNHGPSILDNKVVDHCTEGVGVDADEAEVEIAPGNYYVSIRILGPANDVDKNFLRICSELVSDHDNVDTNHCIIDDVEVGVEDLKRNSGKSISTTLSKKLFDDNLEDQIWSFTNGDRFRNAQIDLWEVPLV